MKFEIKEYGSGHTALLKITLDTSDIPYETALNIKSLASRLGRGPVINETMNFNVSSTISKDKIFELRIGAPGIEETIQVQYLGKRDKFSSQLKGKVHYLEVFAEAMLAKKYISSKQCAELTEQIREAYQTHYGQESSSMNPPL